MTKNDKKYILEDISKQQSFLGIPPCFEFSESKVLQSYRSISNAICSIGSSGIFDGDYKKAEKWILFEILKRYIETLEV